MLHIRNVYDSDLSLFHEIWSDKETSAFIVDRETSPLSFDRSKEKFFTEVTNANDAYLIFEDKNRVQVGFGQIIKTDEDYVVVYALSPAWRGRGLGKLALKMLVELIPTGSTIRALVHPLNIPSHKVLNANGFVNRGIRAFDIGERLLFVKGD
jgi:RimJ/RimL family protein N-acetyltransferase